MLFTVQFFFSLFHNCYWLPRFLLIASMLIGLLIMSGRKMFYSSFVSVRHLSFLWDSVSHGLHGLFVLRPRCLNRHV